MLENSTYTAAIETADPLTLDKLVDLFSALPKLKCPFRQFVESRGRNFDDIYLIVPMRYFKLPNNRFWAIRVPENVRFGSAAYWDDVTLILPKYYVDGVMSLPEKIFNTKMIDRDEADFAFVVKALWERATHYDFVELVVDSKIAG